MEEQVDPTDPRVAPVVLQLVDVTQRVYAAWQRMGFTPQEQQNKWQDFLHSALMPFVENFGALQVSAERNAATENDVLLRDVCSLAARLDEVPHLPEVAQIVCLLKQGYHAAQPPRLPAGSDGKNGKNAEVEAEADAAVRLAVAADGGKEINQDTQGSSSVPEFMITSLPSFGAVLADLSRASRTPTISSEGPSHPSVERQQEQQSSHSEASTAAAGDQEGKDIDSDSSFLMFQEKEQRCSSVKVEEAKSATFAAAADAIRNLLCHNTHEGVRQLLQTELNRLQQLAEDRLCILQLLCKQRAILHRSAHEQVLLRAAYRRKYLSAEDAKRLAINGDATAFSDDGGERPTLPPWKAASSANSSCFASPLTSPNMSGMLKFSSECANVAEDAQRSLATGYSTRDASEGSARGPGATASSPCVLNQDATRAELQLLLSAASCSFETRFRSSFSGGSCVADRMTLAREEDENPMSATTITASATVTPSAITNTAHAHLTCGEPEDTAASARATVMEVDVSSITAYGMHQDLSQKRLHSEVLSILAAIDEHNKRMEAETQQELRALKTLEVLWRAMSAQRTYPLCSSSTVKPPALDSPSNRVTVVSAGVEPVVVGRERSLPAPAPPNDPPFASLQPEPYKESMESILARCAELQAVFEEEAATQQRQQHLGQSMMSGTSTSGEATISLTRPVENDTRWTSEGSHAHTEGVTGTSARDPPRRPRLPPIVRAVLCAASYAPVLNYVQEARAGFQAHLSTQQDFLVEKTMERLRQMYSAYYAATGDATYAVAPDGELRVALEEELLETLRNDAPPSTDPLSSSSGGTVLLGFQRHLTACQQVREQAVDEIEFLRLRLDIINDATPLVRDYETILREEAEMRATCRERLLNKKVNMAKQLLQEEKTRRRVAKDLPRIVGHLKDLLAAWDALQAVTDPREDTAEEGAVNGGSSAAPSPSSATVVKPMPRPAMAELSIGGKRVRDLLAEPRSVTAAGSRMRSRSASNPPLPSSARSASPAPPPTTRPRTEMRQNVHAGASRAATPPPSLRPAPRSPRPPTASQRMPILPHNGARSVSPRVPLRSGAATLRNAVSPTTTPTSPQPRPHLRDRSASSRPPSHPPQRRGPSPKAPALPQPRRGLSPLPSNSPGMGMPPPTGPRTPVTGKKLLPATASLRSNASPATKRAV